MASEEHVAILRRGVHSWNSWRARNRGVLIDLSRADLSYADLVGADLSRANLGRADLRRADMHEASLEGADLTDADLSDADLAGANLTFAGLNRADLRGANLAFSHLNKSDLRRAQIQRVSLYETSFIDVDLTATVGLDDCTHGGPSVLDHRTLQRSPNIPINFLRGCGLPERLIEYLPSILNQAIQFYSCFISYSHADKAFARRLHDQLQGRGIRCWLDDKQLLPGQVVLDEIDRGIRLWDKVLLCCSEASLQGSPWVDREIEKALQKEERLWKERGGQVLALIPLNLDGYLFKWESSKASVLTARFAPDFTGWERDNAKFEEQFERVVRALRTGERSREMPPEARL